MTKLSAQEPIPVPPVDLLAASGDDALALLDTLVATAPVGLAFVDRDFRYVRINDALAAMNGLAVAAHIGRTVRELFPHLADVWEPHWRRVLETGVPLIDQEMTGPVPGGEIRHALVSYYPVFAADRSVLGLGIVVLDITERKRAENERLLLAEASHLLATSLDYETTLANSVHLVVPRLADECIAYLLNDEGGIEHIEVTHVLPDKTQLARDMLRLYPPDPAAAFGLGGVIRTGEPWLVSQFPAPEDWPAVRDERHLDMISRLGPQSYLTVALCSHGRTLGAMQFVITESARRFHDSDVRFAQELADRFALAIENARLYRAEQRARVETTKALAWLDTVLTTAPVGLGILDNDWRYIHVNDALAAMNGLSPAAHLGHSVRELLPTLADALEPLFKQVVESGIPIIDLEVTGETRADPDQLHTWLASYYPVRLPAGEVTGVGLVVVDITERKRTEWRRTFLDQASHILASSLDYERTLANITRLAVPDFADMGVVYLVDDDRVQRIEVAHVRPDKEARMRELHRLRGPQPIGDVGISRIIRTGEAELISVVTPETFAALHLTPEQRALLEAVGPRSYIGVPLQAQGRIVGVMQFQITETRRRFTELDLDLARELGERCGLAIEHAQLYRQAQEAVAVRDHFLSLAAHELKTPLTSLLGHAQLFQRRATQTYALHERDRQSLAILVAQARRLNDMIAALLDVSRIQSGQLSIQRAPLDLCRLAERVVAEFRPTLGERQVILNLPDAPVEIEGDELRLEQVLLNLLQNAVKYSSADRPVEVRVERRERDVCLAVRDEGVGIPAAAMARLFQRFYRAENVQVGTSGMGIGLYVVKQIVDLHGGMVDVESVEGQGSTFRVILPMSD